MAAIIAKITRENRERKIRIKKTLPINKSNYKLPPFKEAFCPEIDNKYLFRRPPVQYKQAIQARVDELVAKEIARQDRVTCTKCGLFMEILLILCSLMFVPVLAYLIDSTWPT